MPDPHAHLNETPLDSEQVFSGRLLDVRRDRVRLPDGREGVREYIVHPGAVVIIGLLDDGSLLFERQHRYPLRRAFLELPAGKIDPERTSWPPPVANCWRKPGTAPPNGAISG